jgi:SpoVK/Ycf46/Vps4 family AAA+-type ATPase
VLDNIEIILGSSSAAAPSAQPTDSNSSSSLGVPTASSYTPRQSTRTTHAALDRVLSTLLVEMDGISKHFNRGGSTSSGHNQSPDNVDVNNAVIVIATTSNSQLIDRYT